MPRDLLAVANVTLWLPEASEDKSLSWEGDLNMFRLAIVRVVQFNLINCVDVLYSVANGLRCGNEIGWVLIQLPRLGMQTLYNCKQIIGPNSLRNGTDM